MSEEPFVMLSLKGDKAKKLAHALTNKSADKILAYLANKKDASESQIAKALKLPVSTVNYTMKVLIEAKLVVAEEYHYSTKGREVNHYKLAKKYIIIAPDEDDNTFFQRMKKYVPAFGITVGVAAIFRFFQGLTTTVSLSNASALQYSARITSQAAPAAVAPEVMNEALRAGANVAEDMATDVLTEEVVQEIAVEGVPKVAEVIQSMPEPTIIIQSVPVDWFPYFLLGVLTVLVLVVLIEYFRRMK